MHACVHCWVIKLCLIQYKTIYSLSLTNSPRIASFIKENCPSHGFGPWLHGDDNWTCHGFGPWMKTGHDMDLDPPIWAKKLQNWPYGPTFIEDKGLSMETAPDARWSNQTKREEIFEGKDLWIWIHNFLVARKSSKRVGGKRKGYPLSQKGRPENKRTPGESKRDKVGEHKDQQDKRALASQ